MAYSRAAAGLVCDLLDDLDYVEYPYELLMCNAAAAEMACNSTAVLHCASLSLASGDPPDAAVLHTVADWADRLDSPWVGEHFAFVAARNPGPWAGDDPGREDRVFNIGFAISPPLNADTVESVAEALAAVVTVVRRPFVIENSPVYFPMPGSGMGQGEAFTALTRLSDVGVLMDLAHLLITCDTMGLDPLAELRRFPLDRVVEVHLSGVSRDSGVLWDDHASAPVAAEYELLNVVLHDAPVRAITHEYNWAPRFPADVARREIDRTHQILGSR